MDLAISIPQPSSAIVVESNNQELEEPSSSRYPFRKRKVQQTKVVKNTKSARSSSQKKTIAEEKIEPVMNSENKNSEASTSGKNSTNKNGDISDDERNVLQEKSINQVEKIEEEESKAVQEPNIKRGKSPKPNKKANLKRKYQNSAEGAHIQKKTKLAQEEAKDSDEKITVKLNKAKSAQKISPLESEVIDFEFQKEEKNEVQSGTRMIAQQSVSTTTENTSDKMTDFETNSNAMEILNQPVFGFFEQSEKKTAEKEEELKESEEGEGSQHMLTAHDTVIRTKGGNFQAKVPRLRMKNIDKKFKQVWSPEMINREEFLAYMNKITEILKTPSDRLNEEKIIKILTENERNVGKSFEYIKKNINSVRREVVLRNRYSLQ